MRYQNPLYALVAHSGPFTPKARRESSSSGKQTCSEAAEGCQQCQELAKDVKRLTQEKQELLADVINTNQAFMRLQRDHTALLQQLTELKLKQQKQHQLQQQIEQQLQESQQQQHSLKDAGQVPEAWTVPEQQQQRSLADPARHSLSAMLDRLLPKSDQTSPAATAAASGPDFGLAAAAPKDAAAAADELETPRLEATSSPVKRKRARWNKATPLRNSFKSLGDRLSAAHTNSSCANPSTGLFSTKNSILAPRTLTPPTSPKGLTAPRSPRVFSRLRASFSGRLSFSGRQSFSGRRSFSGRISSLFNPSTAAAAAAAAAGNTEPPKPLSSRSTPIIDVATLTHINRPSSGGGSNGSGSAAAMSATGSSGGGSAAAVPSVRHSLDSSSAAAYTAFSRNSSGGGARRAAGSGAMRHGVDGISRNSSAGAASASKLGLSVRTGRTGSFGGRGTGAVSVSEDAESSSAGITADLPPAIGDALGSVAAEGNGSRAGVGEIESFARAGTAQDSSSKLSSAGGRSRCDSHEVGSLRSSFAGTAAAAAAAAAVSVGVRSSRCDSHEVGSLRSSFAGAAAVSCGGSAAAARSSFQADHNSSSIGGNSSGGGSATAAGAGAPMLHSSLNSNRYYSALSYESGSSCGSHRLSDPSGCSDSGASPPAAADESAQGENSGMFSSARSNVAGNSLGSSSSSKVGRPSHLRPVSPKSRALKDLVSPTLAADTPTPEAPEAAAAAETDSDVDGHVTVAEGTAAVSAEVPAGTPLLGDTTTAAAAAAAAAAPAKGVSSVAAAVAELLQPISGNPNSTSKVTFLTSRRYGSKYSSSSSSKVRSVPSPEQLRASRSAVNAIPPYPYFGRVWDKWSKMKLTSPVGSPQKGQGAIDPADSAVADSAGLADSAAAVADSAAHADSAVPEMWSIQLAESALADSAVVAEMWSRQQAQAAAATAAAVEAAALDLGMLAASAASAPADNPAAAAAAAASAEGFLSVCDASDCEAGEKLAAWPLELGSEFEYEAPSLRPSLM